MHTCKSFLCVLALTTCLFPLSAHAEETGLLDRISSAVKERGNQVIRDINYAGADNPRQSLDLIIPKTDSEKPLPLLIFIHGGGWHQGNKSHGHRFLNNFVRNNEFAAATINYRLSQEAIWPAQIHDCKAAVRWIKANAEQYNIDPERIAVSGMSAGGHLASMIGGTGHCKTLEGKIGKHLDQSSTVQCVVNLFGPSHFVTLDDKQQPLEKRGPNNAVVRLVGTNPKTQLANARSASPALHIDKKDPPVFIAHGERDNIVKFSQSVTYEAELKKHAVPCTLVKVKGASHVFRSPEVNRRIYAFLQKHLLDKDIEVPSTPVPRGQ